MGVAEQALTRQEEAASIRDCMSEFLEESAHQSVGAGQELVLAADQAEERQGCC